MFGLSLKLEEWLYHKKRSIDSILAIQRSNKVLLYCVVVDIVRVAGCKRGERRLVTHLL